MTLDRLGYLQSMNPAAEQALGYHAAEVIGKHIAKSGMIASDSVAKTLQEFTLTLLGWQRPPFPLHILRKDQSSLILEANPRLIRRERENVRVQVTLHQVMPQQEAA